MHNNAPPTRCSSSLRASYKIWQVVFLSYWRFLLLFTFSFDSFSLLHTHFFLMPLTRYISTSACKFARKLHGANVQSSSNHQELASIGHGNRKDIVWLTKEWQVEKIGDDYTFRRRSSPLCRRFVLAHEFWWWWMMDLPQW